jgi:hypothetical protein
VNFIPEHSDPNFEKLGKLLVLQEPFLLPIMCVERIPYQDSWSGTLVPTNLFFTKNPFGKTNFNLQYFN